MPDVRRLSKFNLALIKTEAVIAIERIEKATRFQRIGLLHICYHAGLVCDTADIVRRWLITGIHNGYHQTGSGSNSRPARYSNTISTVTHNCDHAQRIRDTVDRRLALTDVG